MPLDPLDFSGLAPIYVLPTHMTADDLHSTEDQLVEHGANLTYDANEARLFLSAAATKKRVEYDLRTRKLWTKEIQSSPVAKRESENTLTERSKKRRRRHSLTTIHSSAGNAADISQDDATESETENDSHIEDAEKKIISPMKPSKVQSSPIVIHDSSSEAEADHIVKSRPKFTTDREDIVRETPPRIDSGFEPPLGSSSSIIHVLKLSWLDESLKANKILPFEPYVIYEGLSVSRPPEDTSPKAVLDERPTTPTAQVETTKFVESPSSIMERARADAGISGSGRGQSHFAPAPHGIRRLHNQHFSREQRFDKTHHKEELELLQQTTSEFEGSDSDMPPAPEWVTKGTKYACERSTPANPPNEDFMKELTKIKKARLLTGDEIGVRAYSTSIASIAAYPYAFKSAREVLRLPGCDIKIANLWIEWKNTGMIRAAEEAETDESLRIIGLFFDIWGVGDKTAREFYYDKGWKDLDDVIEYGWKDLSRVQQIGVKFYEEFQNPIPRAEVESIASVIKDHAIKVRDEGIELLIVGGHRRGKKESNDVDVIVSHRDSRKTLHLARDITRSLEGEEWITHTLLLAETMTDRGQSTLPFKSRGVASHGVGFDTLDKSLVVWQDPHWSTKDEDLKRDSNTRNPNIHRRVDIIISPWRTVGCAVCGWSGGTTFQRDLRRYAKNVKGWKFDSSGVRDRSTGEVIALEGPDGVTGSMIDAEKAVFAGFGLIYREPWERWTG